MDSLRTLYASEEFFEGKEDNLNYYSFLEGETYLRKTARGGIQRFEPYAKGRRLLEVASAAGFFLVEAKAAGFEAEGVEFSGPMARYASERWDGPRAGGLHRGRRSGRRGLRRHRLVGRHDHHPGPSALMAKFHAALKPGGVWAFNTYDNRSWWGRLWGTKWYIIVPNTSQIHNDRTLRGLIDEAGFDPSWPVGETGPTPASSASCSCCCPM